jgi:hypothetical protein
MNWLEIGLVISFLILGSMVYLKQPRPVGKKSDGIRPALVPWRFFGSVELKELGNGRHRLLVEHSPHVRQKDAVSIEFDASSAGALQLHGLLVQWAEPEIKVTLKRLNERHAE